MPESPSPSSSRGPGRGRTSRPAKPRSTGDKAPSKSASKGAGAAGDKRTPRDPSAKKGPRTRSGRPGAARPGVKPPRPAGAAGDHQAVDPGRDADCRFVAHQVGKWPNLALADLRLPPTVSGRDAALAHAIYDAVARRWVTLEYIIRQKSETPWDNLDKAVRAALLVGSAQVLILDRVPAYAALNHVVQWTKINVSGPASRFVNAVMRRVAELRPKNPGDPEKASPESIPGGVLGSYQGGRNELPAADGRSLMLTLPLLPEDPRERLRIATGHGPGVWHSWQHLGDDDLRARALHSLVLPPVVMNTANASRETIERFDMIQPHSMPGHHVFVGPAAAIAGMMAADPGVWVQDGASSHAVRLLSEHVSARGRSAMLVVDLCAGQGTKTRQLATLMPWAEVLASDTDERRLITLAESFAGEHWQAGERVKVMPMEKLLRVAGAGRADGGRADVVLLDVPCSNTGVLARRPEAKYRLTPKSMLELVALQREIIKTGVGLLSTKPGSTLVYSTCSLEAAENQEQAAWTQREFGLRQAWVHALTPAGLPGESPSKYHDGSFAVGLVRG
ncbi:MAG: hypothetical protein K2X32_06410 [Phycisphaerales bacterium]|nr:hypothetical protein [Phycisphaerales bacterium]